MSRESQTPPLVGLSHALPDGGVPLVMGIVNVTPDSFSDGERWATTERAVEQALRLAEQGADVLDIGGESTRPGADPVTEGQESDRVAPVIAAIRARWDGVISIDTMKPAATAAPWPPN
ncbi:dihydropteroate synthase, partial [Mesorhizobium japonicum]|uniref:dihydropteroate synthase n=1 Tax=Mesorhizobium japonicum TaxID=2066070 RepID=UPI003B594D66